MLTDKYKSKLFSYQIESVNNIIRILKANGSCLDASDTGSGKSFVGAAACAQLELSPIIICPLAVMATWKKVCQIFQITPFFIVNYETIKIGKYYTEKGRKKCKYIKYNEETNQYTWVHLNNEKIIFIFDEVHRCTNLSSQNGLLLVAAKQTNAPLLILSATLADTPEKFKMFAYILNFIDKETVKNRKITFEQYISIVDQWIQREDPMIRIHNMLYPTRATRLRIQAIPNFPETQITAQPYNIGQKKELEIENEYTKIKKLLLALQDKKTKDKANVLVAILRAHQRIEILKTTIFIDLTNDLIVQGKSVVIFVNFTDTLKLLSDNLKTTCLIWGEQTNDERQTNIEAFQANTQQVIICNIKAGSLGISLHDLSGQHPRVSLISPTWSAIDLIQALGRIHRAGAKSKSLQRIVYVANTIEEKIAEKLEIKLKDLNSINNGDVDARAIVFETRHAQRGERDRCAQFATLT